MGWLIGWVSFPQPNLQDRDRTHGHLKFRNFASFLLTFKTIATRSAIALLIVGSLDLLAPFLYSSSLVAFYAVERSSRLLDFLFGASILLGLPLVDLQVGV